MLVFQQLLHLKTKPLGSAIDDWVAMVGKLKELAKDAGDMRTYTNGTAWKGENAGVTKPFVTRTAAEFQDAVIQAESITNLLKGAYRELTKAQSELEAIYQNPPHGLKIAPDGVITHPEGSDAAQGDVDALISRLEALLQRAADADALCAWGLADLTKDPNEFSSAHYGSLKDAKTGMEQAARTKLDTTEYAPPGKWGSGTVKPVAEFLSYRSWMGGSEALLRGDLNGAVQGFIGGTPSFAAGEASKHLEKGSLLSDVKGKHHRPTFINTIGKFGGKIFGAPVAVVATGIDFYYTPSKKAPGDTSVEAPAAPGKVRYR
ncbi:hypothetical protein LIX60_26800 [Streptomyces sp. S07_1.15]|uniref:hypothetical protein n=1 Tax=Streptomyces sp. S07_1.15 TaxID=2873925 RepID=UPI001D152319|nr:hypothetical protein [Streptomyces sp. S07_1.15]MCC3655014.1 hypothetical protein [Streptomyces sp. S07_1.15]